MNSTKAVDENTILVDLGSTPQIPVEDLQYEVMLVNHEGEGEVEVQKRTDGLYVNGCKVVLYRLKSLQRYIHHDRYAEVKETKVVLNATVLDALLEHPHLIPDEWKKDEEGYTAYICFWDTLYRSSLGYDGVRYLYWANPGVGEDTEQWDSHCVRIGDLWRLNSFVACLEKSEGK